MIRTIVVDDEWYNLEEVCDYVEKTGFMRVESRCQSGAEALSEADRVKPQAAFIDIEMPEMDGLTLAEKLLEKYPEMKIIFITGWNQYAVAAFELNALDYIMKPLNRARFQKMAERLKSRMLPEKNERRDELQVRCFGGLKVSVGGSPVVWKRIKAEELFAFLLVHHDLFVHKDIILENLWPNYERTKSLPILQTSVCKIRNIFSSSKNEVKLSYADSKYGLFLSGADCDYLEIESALTKFREARPETFEAVENVCKIFQKGLFSGCGYLWSESVNENMRQRFVSALRAMSCFYREQKDKARELASLRLLTRLSPTDENDQMLFIKALRARGRKKEIADYKTWLCETLRTDYDVGLPKALEEALEEKN